MTINRSDDLKKLLSALSNAQRVVEGLDIDLRDLRCSLEDAARLPADDFCTHVLVSDADQLQIAADKAFSRTQHLIGLLVAVSRT
jgi:hypothetical protein